MKVKAILFYIDGRPNINGLIKTSNSIKNLDFNKEYPITTTPSIEITDEFILEGEIIGFGRIKKENDKIIFEGNINNTPKGKTVMEILRGGNKIFNVEGKKSLVANACGTGSFEEDYKTIEYYELQSVAFHIADLDDEVIGKIEVTNE